MRYIKQLDALRAIAVILVIYSHWIPGSNPLNRFPLGGIGVGIFFVLSGFLITRILLENKAAAESLSVSRVTILKHFFFRRTLRIFPIYYLTIIILYVFHDSTETDIKSSFIYFATYTSNFYFFFVNKWDGMLSHLWSLAVEEQFYLFWPFVVLFVKKRYLLAIILLFILVGIVTQVFLQRNPMGHILTFTCFDSFGFGALLSYYSTYKQQELRQFYKAVSITSTLVLFLLLLNSVLGLYFFIPFRTTVSVLTLWIISTLIIKRENLGIRVFSVFNSTPLIFLGKISYGIYLHPQIIPPHPRPFNFKQVCD